jgi:predicted permease
MILRDVAFALRGFRKAPGFAAVVVVSIALGIAANTTVFSMVNATLLGALPVRDASHLYSIGSGRTFPYPDYRDFRDQGAGVFNGLAGHFPLAPASLGITSGTPERVWGALVTGNYFSVVGPPMRIGRGIGPEDDRSDGGAPVVVLSDTLWRRRFAANPMVLDQTAVFNGRKYTIVGVTAPGFHGSDRGIVDEFWAPLSMRGDFLAEMIKDVESRTNYWIVISGRLQAGVSTAQAAAAVNVVYARMEKTYRHRDVKDPLPLAPAGRFPGEAAGLMSLLSLLMVVVALVLLIACANVANLLLARAVERQREIGIRLAVGASRGRLITQLLTESVVLAAFGAAAGFALAWVAARALSNFQLPIPIPFALDFTPDYRVLAFTGALTVATGVLFGIAPALLATRTDLVSALKGAETGIGIFRRFGLRNLLVAAQVTLSTVLLIAAGLFVRSLGSAASMDLGIQPQGVLMMALDPQSAGYSGERFREFLRQLETRVAALPGVQSAAATNILPLSLVQNNDAFRDASADQTAKPTGADIFAVSGGFFQTLGLPVVRGRTFRPESDLKAPAALINLTMARRLFGDRDPIGRTIRRGADKAYEIVGVTGDSKSVTLGEEVKACVYLYLPRETDELLSLVGLTILVKAGGEPVAMTRAVRDEILKIDPTLAVFHIDTMRRHVSKAFLVPRLCATLFGIFGVLGLSLAAVGLFGVVSYSVRSRTREIGIRMALGADAPAVLRLVARQALGIVAAGLALGLAAAAALSRFTSSLLYGVSAHDAVTFLGVPAALLAAAAAAVFLPARRACAIRPMDAVRLE